jgi:ketosteroid isomerase-like protein
VIVLGPYSAYKATGRAVDVPVRSVFRVRDGQIWHWQQFTDAAAFRAAAELQCDKEMTWPSRG